MKCSSKPSANTKPAHTSAAFDRIAAGLENAIAYAKGDMTRAHIIYSPNTYAVRIKATKQAVGIVTAFDAEGLQDVIDEMCDPGLCEIRLLGIGGVFVVGKKERWCEDVMDEPESPMRCRLSGDWDEDIFGGHEWVDMPPVDIRAKYMSGR